MVKFFSQTKSLYIRCKHTSVCILALTLGFRREIKSNITNLELHTVHVKSFGYSEVFSLDSDIRRLLLQKRDNFILYASFFASSFIFDNFLLE